MFEYSPVEGFRESNLLLRISRNSYRPSVLSCACTPMSYTLTSKSFTLSQKKKRQSTGCLSDFLNNFVVSKAASLAGRLAVVAILFAQRRDIIHAKHFVSVLSPLASKSSGRSHTRKEICFEIKMMRY